MWTRLSCKPCSMIQVRSTDVNPVSSTNNKSIGKSFTPWFKLIARDFLFGWWDELIARRDQHGKVQAKSLAGLVDGSKVVSMV